MKDRKTSNQGYNYDFVVERKYPLLRLLEEVRRAINIPNYIDYRGDAKKKEVVSRNRLYIKDRFQLIHWVMETMVENSPNLVRNGGYMESYNTLKVHYPDVIATLSKEKSFKDSEVQLIEKLAMSMHTFLIETT